VELQVALSFDEQDRELGQDTYSLSTESGAACYGGIESWTVSPAALDLVLSKQAADALDLPERLVIDLEASPEQLSSLREGLHRVLSSSAMPG
jgi:hypothetical protein